MRFESGNDDASLVERRSSGAIDADEEVESPLFNVRMKVSSATQTEVI